MSTQDELSLEELQSCTWIEALEKFWLPQLYAVLPKEISESLLDLVNTCRGLIDTGSAMQTLILKLYSERVVNENLAHRLEEDESNGFITRDEYILLDKLSKDEIFSFFLSPLSQFSEEIS